MLRVEISISNWLLYKYNLFHFLYRDTSESMLDGV